MTKPRVRDLKSFDSDFLTYLRALLIATATAGSERRVSMNRPFEERMALGRKLAKPFPGASLPEVLEAVKDWR